MAAHLAAFSSDGFETAWTTWDGAQRVELSLRWDNEAWTASVRSEREAVECVFRISPTWQVRQFLLFRDLDEPDLWLGTDGRNRWGEVNGAHRPDLDGCVDVDVATGPFGWTLPIRRLPLADGDTAELQTANVDVHTLGVVPERRRLTRLGHDRWQLDVAAGSRALGSTVTFDVDVHGVPVDVEGAFRRCL